MGHYPPVGMNNPYWIVATEWAVYSFARLRSEAIRDALPLGRFHTWKEAYRKGFRAYKVSLAIIK